MKSLRLLLAVATICLVQPSSGEARLRFSTTGGEIQQHELGHLQALFGIPRFSGSLRATLRYDPNVDHDGCQPYPPSTDTILGPVIVMSDRGSCSFVQKVRDGQNAGAAAVIITNNVPNTGLVLMADDGSASDITIPSVFISQEDGNLLKAQLAMGHTIIVELIWSMPHPDDHVEWTMWTSAADNAAELFKTQFGSVVAALGQHASFVPRYMIADGHMFGCTTSQLRCGNQCINSGRYCAQDPDGDFAHGISGMQVVSEDLRQMCIWRHVNSTGHAVKWWTYAGLFASHCVGFLPNSTMDMSRSCSERQQIRADIDPQLTQACVTAAGGDSYRGGVNTMLQAELDLKTRNRVWVMPSLFVNKEAYRGSLACPAPISLSTCPVLGAICAGFPDEDKPPACQDTYCWQARDVCGVCGGDGSSCRGCDGQPNSGKVFDDCHVCGGDGSFDQCGNCYPQGSDLRDKSCAGCDGVPNSGVTLDACGKCGGDGSFDKCGKCFPQGSDLRDKSCLGCDGVPNSGLRMDPCGVCGGDGSFDKCGRCFAANSTARQNDFCRDDKLVDVVQVTLELHGVSKPAFIQIEQRFETVLAEVIGHEVTALDIAIEDITPSESAATTLAVRLHIRSPGGHGIMVSEVLQAENFISVLSGKLSAQDLSVAATKLTTEPKVTHMAGSEEETIWGMSREAFIAVITSSIVFLAILVPVAFWGGRKWCAYRDLLKQYEMLKNQSDDFPEVDIGDVNLADTEGKIDI